MVFLLSFGAEAQESGFLNHLSAGLQIGSDGLGIELASPLGSSFRARAGYSFLPSIPYRKTVSAPEHPGAVGSAKGKDIPVDAKASLHMSDIEVFLDYYPMSYNGFHVSAGLLCGSRKVVSIKNVTPLPDDYNIVGLDVDGYTVKAVRNTIEGYIATNSLRPYLGVGYDIRLHSMAVMKALWKRLRGLPSILYWVSIFTVFCSSVFENEETLDNNSVSDYGSVHFRMRRR